MIRRAYDLSAQIHSIVPTPVSKRSTASNGHNNDEYDFEMELDEQLGVHNGNSHSHSNPRSQWGNNSHNGAERGDDTMDTLYANPDSHSLEDDEEDDDADADAEAAEARHAKLMQDTIIYGMELKAEFANDSRREVKRALEDTFALIAYENVGESSLAPLLDAKGRGPVAEELNGRILGKHLSFSFPFFFMTVAGYTE